ncbi:Alpha-amylase [Rasamsonia emersonii CBS 393.64]|uniref:alpha-amylase n=1 Tax=Rasamsonia emersonii (strain ATCC 16479 / CBS 393.64 / IMI 116815) TaxID=1408163 RepID=A0A0F4YLU9_RASE3|nr:Alpha-amylase [Rasamsonia emersonii CBS 393.64]KKA19189.1 Alpha-amylase [Rasamsonia emersonii CBS 393.64]
MALGKVALAAFAACTSLVQAASRDQWISRSIYQIVTDRFARSDNSTTAPCDAQEGYYCGGDFQGIINKLDYIQDLGFSALFNLLAYHGYWPRDLYSINSHFGSPEDLKALSDALHARGMYLMLDVVVNDMAWAGNASTVDYSQFNPFNSEEYFHPYRLLSDDPLNETCVIDCWLGDTIVSLPDVRTEDDKVASMLYFWITELVSNYSVDGLRIDSVFNVDPGFWPDFNSSAGVFCIGEGSTRNATELCPLQDGLNGLLNYPLYYILTESFNDTASDLNTVVRAMEFIMIQCKDIFALGTFTENQDVPRFASYTQDLSLARNIITFNLLGDGIPVFYYGEEQHLSGAYNPVNREALWLTDYSWNTTSLPFLVKSLNRLRSYAAVNGTQFTAANEPGNDYLTFIMYPIYNSTHILALRKGFVGNQVISVLSNLGTYPDGNVETKIVLNATGTGFQPGQSVTEILSCQTVLTDENGNLDVDLHDGGPRVYYPTDSLNIYSDLCGHHEAQPATSGNSSSGTSPKKSDGSLSTSSDLLNVLYAVSSTLFLVMGFPV